MRVAILAVLLFPLALCAGRQEAEMTRSPAVAGQFYPADSSVLAAEVDAMLAAAPSAEPDDRLVAIQVPHAGYPYSGPTAARAFKLLSGMEGVTVVMVGPSHRVMVTGGAVFPKGSWRTPLGRVAVDEELAAELLAREELFKAFPEAHGPEHSLEVQLPFLQRRPGSFRILPVLVLQPGWPEVERMGRALAEVCRGRNVLLLVSTDLYHGESYADAKRFDSLTVELFAGLDPATLHAALDARRAQACGGYAMAVAMVAARELGANRAHCYDLDGNRLWERDLGKMITRLGWGEGASPVVHGDNLIVNWDHEGQSFLVVLDPATGETKWRVERDEVTSWTTPLAVEYQGRMQLIVPATGRITSYDLATGERFGETARLGRIEDGKALLLVRFVVDGKTVELALRHVEGGIDHIQRPQDALLQKGVERLA
ncbi:MAG: AmmeMemoRadiSam system protein B [bacterium]